MRIELRTTTTARSGRSGTQKQHRSAARFGNRFDHEVVELTRACDAIGACDEDHVIHVRVGEDESRIERDSKWRGLPIRCIRRHARDGAVDHPGNEIVPEVEVVKKIVGVVGCGIAAIVLAEVEAGLPASFGDETDRAGIGWRDVTRGGRCRRVKGEVRRGSIAVIEGRSVESDDQLIARCARGVGSQNKAKRFGRGARKEAFDLQIEAEP